MGKGSYLGGSTVIRAYRPTRPNARRKGLLSLEVEFRKTGKVSPQTLAPPKPAKKKQKPKSGVSAAAKMATSGALAVADKVPARGNTRNKGVRAGTGREAAPTKAAAASTRSPRYSVAEIGEYLRQHHPNCTKSACKRVATLASQGSWTGMGPAEVVASCMENYLLHEVCGLQRLVEFGIARDRALEMVMPQVKAVLSLWGAKAVWLK